MRQNRPAFQAGRFPLPGGFSPSSPVPQGHGQRAAEARDREAPVLQHRFPGHRIRKRAQHAVPSITRFFLRPQQNMPFSLEFRMPN